MNKKLFCSAVLVAVAGIVLLSAYLASAAPPEGKGYDRVLEKITFIHYRKGHAKPPWAGGGSGKDKTAEQGYYTFIANGARWKTIEPYVFNPENNSGLSEAFVGTAMSAGMDEWEKYGGNIFGTLSSDSTAQAGTYDLKNVFSFGDYADPGVIAVTTVWGYFSGPPRWREIVEADILFNTDFDWGDGAHDSSLMDLQNIATHEIGHCAGMGDLYESAAADETMYGYSTEGETKKRDLYTGDITGIVELYK